MSRELVSRSGALFAEFDSAEATCRAYEQLRSLGYEQVETYSPYPLTEDQGHDPGPWTALALVVFTGGLLGGLTGYLVQWLTNVQSYALNIGGRPAHAAAAFMIPTFETIVLFAGVVAFAAVLIALRLPRLWRPELEVGGFERVSIDGFWIAVRLGTGGGDVGRTTRELTYLDARRVLHVSADE